MSKRITYHEDGDIWAERTETVETVRGFEMTGVSYRWWPKRRAWYRCAPCGVEWPSSTHVDELCPRCGRDGGETEMAYLGMRPEPKPEEWHGSTRAGGLE